MEVRCESCKEPTEDLAVCPRDDCEDMRELCADCLFEHETEHEELGAQLERTGEGAETEGMTFGDLNWHGESEGES